MAVQLVVRIWYSVLKCNLLGKINNQTKQTKKQIFSNCSSHIQQVLRCQKYSICLCTVILTKPKQRNRITARVHRRWRDEQGAHLYTVPLLAHNDFHFHDEDFQNRISINLVWFKYSEYSMSDLLSSQNIWIAHS